MISLKTIFCSHKARVCPNGFEATFAVMFVLIYRLRECPLSTAREGGGGNLVLFMVRGRAIF